MTNKRTIGELIENEVRKQQIPITEFAKMICEVILELRKNGQGAEGHKKPVLFPKLNFLYIEHLHGEDKEDEYLFDLAIQCSAKAMYPKKIGA